MQEQSKTVVIHSDGACQGNPGPGGWAAIMRYGKHCLEISGYEANTTNNRMEMRAVIEALRTLTRTSQVELYTDSEYLRKGITEWVLSWMRRGWKTSTGKPVKNQELWEALYALTQEHQIKWSWLKGHAGHPDNERADQLARDAIQQRQGVRQAG